MKKLQCEICGGYLVMNLSGDLADCESCGMQFKKETIQKMLVELSGPIKIDGAIHVEGLASLDKLVKNAEKLCELGEYDKAFAIFTKITSDYPEDYRGWWGLVTAWTHNFEISARFSPEMRCIKEKNYALMLASGDNKENLVATYESWDKQCDAALEQKAINEQKHLENEARIRDLKLELARAKTRLIQLIDEDKKTESYKLEAAKDERKGKRIFILVCLIICLSIYLLANNTRMLMAIVSGAIVIYGFIRIIYDNVKVNGFRKNLKSINEKIETDNQLILGLQSKLSQE